MLKFLVKGQKIEVLEREVIASDQIAFVLLKFIFEGTWKELHKVVQFTQNDETYNLVLGTDGLSCKLPAELNPGQVRMSIFGYSTSNTDALRATTVPVTLHIRPSGFVSDGADSIPPTPDLYAQLLEQISSVQSGADGETPNLSGYATTEQFSTLESNIQQLSDSTQYDFQNANDRILSLENQVQGLLSTVEKSKNFTTIFNYGSSVIDNYGEKIYTYYNDGYRSLSGFVQSYPNFCSAENEYALSFNQTDFSWAGTVFVLFLESVKITSASQLLLCYTSSAGTDVEMYFVPKSDATGADLAQHIYETIQSGDAISAPCKWLYTDDFITVLQSLESVTNGEYYLAFKGVSDNSHPIIRSIKIMEG